MIRCLIDVRDEEASGQRLAFQAIRCCPEHATCRTPSCSTPGTV